MINEIRNSITKFAALHIEPTVEADDEHSVFRPEIFQGLGDLGLCSVILSPDYGGSGLTYKALCAALEELAKSSASYAVTLSVSTMVQSMIALYGTKLQKEKYLPMLASGAHIGSFALSESHAGSDAKALKTTAKKTEGGFILQGNKMWITSGGVSSVYIVMAKTAEDEVSAFILEKDTQGFSFGKKEKKMGWRASPTRELIFQDCFIAKEQLLGKLGEGFKLAMAALDRGRITIAAVANGVSQAALDKAISYTLERKQFGQAIFDFQGLQFILAQDATELQCAKLLVEKAADCFDQGGNNVMLAAMAKMKASDVAMQITTNAVQALGGVGYTSEYGVERYMRDAKVLQIVEGTNQIQKIVIARSLKKLFS
jgi:alkylation response protein AidB-like acyl-CoA dehydrogenase